MVRTGFDLAPRKATMRLAVVALLVVSAYAAKWTVIQSNIEPVLLGIALLNNQTAYMSGGQDGTPPVGGPQAYKSTDAGKTWNWLPHQGSCMMFLDIACQSTTSCVTAGIGLAGVVPGIEYTTNGQWFNASDLIELEEQSQSVEPIFGVNGGYGVTGGFQNINGVAVSTDFGKTFNHIDAKVNTSTRYGSFPTSTNWYLTAGQWPDEQRQEPGSHQLTKRLKITRVPNAAAGQPKYKVEFNTSHISQTRRPRRAPGDFNGYMAAITQTSDGGKSWATTFYDQGNFYFNAIDCTSANECWAVGEADDGANPGVRIYHTADSGKSWQRQMYNSNPTYSLIAIEMVDNKVGWAAGGELDATFAGHFWFTADGGNTWTLNKVPGVYGNYMAFSGTASAYMGMATAFTWEDQSSVLQYA